MEAIAGAAVARRRAESGGGAARPGPARGSFPEFSAQDFSRGSLPGLSEDSAAAAGSKAMLRGGTADCGLQVSGGGWGRGRVKPTLGNGACEQVTAIGNT